MRENAFEQNKNLETQLKFNPGLALIGIRTTGPKLVLVSKYSTELFSVMVPGRGRSQGCHGYLLFMLEHFPAPPTL